MKSSLLELIKKNIFLLSFLLTFTILLIVMLIVGIEPFGEKSLLIGDSYDQYLPFFSVLRSKVLAHDLGVHDFSYSWEVGIGANFLLLFFYYLASPLSLLVLFVPKSGIVGMLSIIIMLKISLSSATFSYLLSRREDYPYSFVINIALSTAYGLSGYVCGYYWNVMWLDSLVLLPVVILGLDKILKGKSPILYIISLCLTIYTNFYTAFMVCIFLVLYVVFFKHESWKKFFKRGLTFALSSLLAAGMTAVSICVTYFGIGHTMTADYGRPSFGLFGNVFYSLRQAFFLTRPVTVDNTRYNGYANLYAGVIVLVLVVVYMVSDKYSLSDKLRRLGMVFILLLSMNERVLNYVWHGFHEQFLIPNRFSFLLIFVLLIMAYEAFDCLRGLSIKRLLPACLVAIIYPIVCFVFVDFDGLLSSTAVVMINCALIAVYSCIILLYNKFVKKRKNVVCILAVLIIAELSVNTFMSFKDSAITKDVSELYALDDVLSEEKESEDALYREELMNPVLTNGTSFVGIKGASVFCSTISGGAQATMMDIGHRGLTNQYEFMGYSPFTMSLLGIRNIYYTGEGEVSAYENEMALPIGFAVSRELENYTPDSENDAAKNLNSFAALATGSDVPIFTDVSSDMEATVYNATAKESTDMANSLYLTKTGADNPILQLDYDIEAAGTYYLYMRATNYDNLTVVVNDNLFAQGAIFNGMLEIPGLNAGDHLTVYFEASGETPVIWYLDRYDDEVASTYLKYFSSRGIDVTDFSEGDFSFDVDIEEGEMLMLTIPYDKGWKVYDMDNLLETVPVLRGFTGVELGQGQHSIRMVYTPEGFYLGLFISIVSWIGFIIITIKKIKDSFIMKDFLNIKEQKMSNNTNTYDRN